MLWSILSDCGWDYFWVFCLAYNRRSRITPKARLSCPTSLAALRGPPSLKWHFFRCFSSFHCFMKLSGYVMRWPSGHWCRCFCFFSFGYWFTTSTRISSGPWMKSLMFSSRLLSCVFLLIWVVHCTSEHLESSLDPAVFGSATVRSEFSTIKKSEKPGLREGRFPEQ